MEQTLHPVEPFQWNNLIDDMLTEICLILDPATRLMLSLTCHKECNAYPLPSNNHPSNYHQLNFHPFMNIAEFYGYTNIIEWGTERGFELPDFDSAPYLAIEYGDLELVKWFKNHNYLVDQMEFEYAAKLGRIEIMKWMHSIGISFNSGIFMEAARFGNMEYLLWLYDNKCPHDCRFTIDAAASRGHLEVMQWLMTIGHVLTDMTFDASVESDDLMVMKWLKTNNCPITNEALVNAVRSQCKMDTIIWLLDNGCHLDTEVFALAAAYKDTTVLQWLKEHQCPTDSKSYTMAISAKSMHNLKWLKDNNIPMDKKAFEYAVRYAGFEFMKWLFDNGCPWNIRTYNLAVKTGKQEIKKSFNGLLTMDVRINKLIYFV